MDRTDSDDIEDDIRAEARARIYSKPQADHWFGKLCHSIGLSVNHGKMIGAIAIGGLLGSSFAVALSLDFSPSNIDPLLMVGGYLLFVTALVVLVGTINNHSGNEVGDRIG